MQKTVLTALMVRALKGAPISILVILMIEKRACSQEYLRRCSGYSDENIHDAMLLLSEHGLVVPTGRYEWGLTAGAKQLPLMDALGAGDEAAEEAVADPEPAEVIDVECDESCRISSDNIGPNPSSSSGFNYPESSHKKQPLPDLERRNSGKIGANPREAENLAALDDCGIRDPARTRLARLPHVTPELIEYHCRDAPPGLAIYRIEHNWRMDTPPKSDGSSYYTGEFGEFVEH